MNRSKARSIDGKLDQQIKNLINRSKDRLTDQKMQLISNLDATKM